MMRAGAVDFAQPSVTKIGGVTAFMQVAEMAARHGVTLMPHSPISRQCRWWAARRCC